MNLRVIRILFVALSAILLLVLTDHVLITAKTSPFEKYMTFVLSLVVGLLASVLFVGFEIILSRRMASVLPSVVVGIVLGILSAGLVDRFLSFFDWYRQTASSEIGFIFFSWLFIYLWSLFIVQTRDTFKISIPYVDFKRQGQGIRPFIIDTSALIDGRFVELMATHLFETPMIVPRFVLHELQTLAESSDKWERQKGKRGLDKLRELREKREVLLDESVDHFEEATEQRFVKLARQHDGILVLADSNLCQIASLQDIDSLNLHEMAALTRPVHLPGDTFAVKLNKLGESPAQGVGYLSDGTMVVVEDGASHLHQEVSVEVSSSLQTNMGRMIFARLKND